MRIIFTANNSILSKAIRWTFREPASHVALVFDNDKWLVHSNLLGVNIRLFLPFMRGQRVVDSIAYSIPLEAEEQIFQAAIASTSELDYDWPGFFYFAWRGFLFRILGAPMPKHNPWGRASLQLCTEMVGRVPARITGIPEGLDLGIVTPWRLRNILRGKL